MLLLSLFATVALSTSLASAIPSSDPVEGGLEARHRKSCGYNDFWYSKKSCCVKNGGETPGTPGKGQSCPKNYYWHKSYKFCVPKNPWDDQGDHPKCSKGTKWNDKKNSCNTLEYSCKTNEFWWKDRGCCLKKGGPKPKRNPPRGSKCPSKDWSWDYQQGCCVPHQPTVPEPKCEKGWEWKKGIKCCRPKSTPPTPPPPQPSNKPYDDNKHDDNYKKGNDNNKHGKGHKRDLSSTGETTKRHLALRTSKPVVLNFCPSGYEQCPVAGVGGEFECLETGTEMTSCGGCASTGAGVDCTAIPHVEYASCHGGYCSVFSCEHGFKPSDDERSCVPV